MRTVPFGSTGERVSELCLGTLTFGASCDEAEADRVVSAALERGVTFVDTAAMYGDGETEAILGRILRGKRERVFLGTKVHKGLDRDAIVGSLDESLRRLRTDAVDLYMLHWPKVGMRPVEIVEALDEVRRSGKTRFVGCCNFPAWLLARCNAIAIEHGWARLVCNQIPYNLIERGAEVEVLPQALAENVAITAYRPLVLGLLTGKFRRGAPLPPRSRGSSDARAQGWLARHGEGIERFLALAAEWNVSPSSLAIAWLRHSPAVTCAIVGVTSVRQLDEAIGAFGLDLTDEQAAAVGRCFDTEVKEEAGGPFRELRRELRLLGGT